MVTATWHEHSSIVEQALGRHSLPAVLPASIPTAPRGAQAGRPGAQNGAVSGAAGGDPVYTGLGFDTCAAPSVSQLARGDHRRTAPSGFTSAAPTWLAHSQT